jgi:hypothetical protein
MVYFQKEIQIWVNFGMFCNRIYWYGHLVYITAIWYILFDHLVYFVVIWYIFPHFGMLYKEKSGNPEPNPFFVELNLDRRKK